MENKIKYIELNENTKISSYLVDGEYKIKGNYHPNIDLPFNKYDNYVSGILTVLNISTDSNNLKVVQYFKSAGSENNIYVRKLNGETNNIIVSDWEALTNKEGSGTIIESNDLPVVNVDVDYVDIDNYNEIGIYNISGRIRIYNNYPIINEGVINARLVVLITDNNGNNVKTQVLILNNNSGGESNIYIRSNQNGTWKPWGKLQTNIEVGQITPNDMSNLIDNGIYSGVCVDGTTIETFVLIVINNYLAATQAGFGGYISQLKYAIDLNRGNTVKTRTRDAYGIWNEWSEIGGSTYELPEATKDTLGGVKLGNKAYTNYAPLVKLPLDGGVGIGIDVNYFTKLGSNYFLSIIHNDSLTTNNGLSVKLGTDKKFPIIPCVIGSKVIDLEWNTASVGVPYNTEQFCLKSNGLNLVEGIASGATKVTWDANSNINDYTTAGIYYIEGTRESLNDNLPINNLGQNATISAKLIVTVTPEGATTYRHSIGQTLILTNAEGKETKVYTRNGNRTSTDGGVSYTITWSDWKCLQGMVESYINTDIVSITTTGVTLGTGTTDNVKAGLNGMTENGMYSGIYTDDYTLQSPTFVETFVLVVINDYAVSGQAGTPRRISQLKYATDTLTGQCAVKKRVGTGDDSISWSDWEEIGGGSGEVDITDAVKTYGLPTLVTQGLAKEGVTYVINVSSLSELQGKLDTSDKIYSKLGEVRGGMDSLYKLFIKVIRNRIIIDVYEDGNNDLAYINYYKFIMAKDYQDVKVSTDMTKL